MQGTLPACACACGQRVLPVLLPCWPAIPLLWDKCVQLVLRALHCLAAHGTRSSPGPVPDALHVVLTAPRDVLPATPLVPPIVPPIVLPIVLPIVPPAVMPVGPPIIPPDVLPIVLHVVLHVPPVPRRSWRTRWVWRGGRRWRRALRLWRRRGRHGKRRPRWVRDADVCLVRNSANAVVADVVVAAVAAHSARRLTPGQ